MKVVAIVQARMGSTRLPGKVLKTILGKPMLVYQIERMQRSKLIDQLVIATTEHVRDDPIVELCRSVGVACYRGSEDDVLERYYETAAAFDADAVVRLTADCPLIDPNVIDDVVAAYVHRAPAFQYGSNTEVRTYPRGMDTSVFSFQALEEAYKEAVQPAEREHVTPFIIRHSERYSSFHVTYKRNASSHRWTVDTSEDFELVKRIIEHLYPSNPGFSMEDVLKVIADHPDWEDINRHIEQKDPGSS
ncbi:glycosyltransferase family protein [Halobacillus sp. BAB-2008]|uniref:cytidylyltransferase domain-containing protein n=1 Tax=Halobacillus sp. BAB-2008 TaxID=1246484 RepID=UPI0002A4F8A8|nr:glycosyltransferase family protein [Halobacillus sp. BAB-2008]ELK48292.1 acylneuraminate cytidylyltransferase [Halobacillus sp. BAB-2008]